jgi:hypothetical protein
MTSDHDPAGSEPTPAGAGGENTPPDGVADSEAHAAGGPAVYDAAADDAAVPDTTATAGAEAEVREQRPRANSHNMLPPRERRRSVIERLFVRLIATGGIIGIGVAIAAIMVSSKSQGWLIGLVVSVVSVVLAAILWSSRQL